MFCWEKQYREGSIYVIMELNNAHFLRNSSHPIVNSSWTGMKRHKQWSFTMLHHHNTLHWSYLKNSFKTLFHTVVVHSGALWSLSSQKKKQTLHEYSRNHQVKLFSFSLQALLRKKNLKHSTQVVNLEQDCRQMHGREDRGKYFKYRQQSSHGSDPQTCVWSNSPWF